MFTHPRLNDWTGRWSEFIKDTLDLAGDLRLDWAGINCTQFSGQGIEALTGHNPYEEGEWEGKFTTALSAAKEIKKRGFNTLDDVIASLFPNEVPLAYAWPGDVVLIQTVPWTEEDVRAVMPHGVCLAEPPYFYGVSPEGVGRGDLFKDAVRCFAIGREVAT